MISSLVALMCVTGVVQLAVAVCQLVAFVLLARRERGGRR